MIKLVGSLLLLPSLGAWHDGSGLFNEPSTKTYLILRYLQNIYQLDQNIFWVYEHIVLNLSGFLHSVLRPHIGILIEVFIGFVLSRHMIVQLRSKGTKQHHTFIRIILTTKEYKMLQGMWKTIVIKSLCSKNKVSIHQGPLYLQ